MLTVLGLGAGVQSSTLALMAAAGEVTPMPDCAIFADTGWEPKQVYEWLAWLETKLPFPVHHVSVGNIRDDQMSERRTLGKGGAGNKRFASMPYFVKNPDGSKGMTKRQCTQEYKIEPIERFIRRTLLGIKPRARIPKGVVVEQWRGISADESHRMKPSRVPWIKIRFPLAMELRMSRGDCFAWMARNKFPKPSRSACIGCPFHSDAEWLEIRKRPEEWAEAIAFDKAIRKAGGMNGETFLHTDLVPLDKVEFKEDRYSNHFGNECEGMCGT
jgi:hypothetical protein